MDYKMKRIFKILFFISIIGLFGFCFATYGQGLEGLEAGVRRGTSTIQKIGFVIGSLMFVVGAILLKFNADRGKQVLISTGIGIIFLTIGTSLPESIRSYFN